MRPGCLSGTSRGAIGANGGSIPPAPFPIVGSQSEKLGKDRKMPTKYTARQIQALARELFPKLEDLGIMANNTADERGEVWLDDAIEALRAVARIGEIEE